MSMLTTVILTAIELAVAPQAPMTAEDVVVTTSGKTLTGRVVERWGEEGLVLRRSDGEQRTVPSGDVARVDWLAGRLVEFFALKPDGATLEQEIRAGQWAAEHGLPQLARVQALWVLTIDAECAAAHELLGHRQRGKRWHWRLGDRFVTAARFAREFETWGRDSHLESENWAVQTDAGLRVAAGTLLDLERLYALWFTEFGEDLRLKTFHRRMDVSVRAERDDFAGLSSGRVPYYVPRPFDDRSYTWMDPETGRPAELFSLGSQQILYDSLAGESSVNDPSERFCAWVEVGVGRWMEQRFAGRVGLARPHETAVVDPVQVAEVRKVDPDFVDHLLHRTMTTLHGRVSPSVATDHAGLTLLVTWLMEGTERDVTRPQLLRYLADAVGGAKGDSSSVFKNAFGRSPEELGRPWCDWLRSLPIAGPGAGPGR